jgi:hypothetical protein
MRYFAFPFLFAWVPTWAAEKALSTASTISSAPAPKPGDPPKPGNPDDGKGSKDNPDVLDPLTVFSNGCKSTQRRNRSSLVTLCTNTSSARMENSSILATSYALSALNQCAKNLK